MDRTRGALDVALVSARKGHRGFGHVRKLPSGRWQASYVAPDLQRLNAPHTFLRAWRPVSWCEYPMSWSTAAATRSDRAQAGANCETEATFQPTSNE